MCSNLSHLAHTQLASQRIIYSKIPTLGRDNCYSQVTHLRKRAVSHSRPSICYIHKLAIYEIVFSAGLNGLQVDQVDRENDKRASTYTQLVPSKLIAACNASCSVVQVWPNHTCHTHTIIALKAKKYTKENAKRVGDGFEAIARQSCSSHEAENQ